MSEKILSPVVIPENYNYIAVFLTFACNLKCDYCINHFEGFDPRRMHATGKEWVKWLNRIVSREDLPVTLQGGEPSLHPDFVYIINHIKPELNIDILTNLQFDIDDFMKQVDPARLKRNSPYASIRVSFHPLTMEIDPLILKTHKMLDAGFSIGIWAVSHPAYAAQIARASEKCARRGIDFRVKDFLGEYNGSLHGNFRYPGACDKKFVKTVLCRTTELLMDSSGNVFRCHADLYADRSPIGHIGADDFRLDDKFRECLVFGHCNPCDVKVKTNRFQQFGHTSVEVR